MPAIAWLRSRSVEIGWGVFAAANLIAMARWESWETIPFHFIWVSLTLVYGFRVWRLGATLWTLAVVFVSTGALILLDVHGGSQLTGELFEVPLMSAMFLAMVWHARRRQQALQAFQQLADERASLLERQERFLHDASHELRTPVTIARGHLEVHQRLSAGAPEIDVALDELQRIERIIQRLLLLANADQPDFIAVATSTWSNFWRKSLSAGRRSRRGHGGSAHCPMLRYEPTPRLSATPSTRYSRTPSSTRRSRTRSSSAPTLGTASW